MTYDVIVLGTGGVGSAALFHAARRGARVLGLDRFPPAHDRGSSHGTTRIIRQAYFEHPDYVPLLLAAYARWQELAALCGEQLYCETGLVEIGPQDGIVVPGVLESASRHKLEVDQLTAGDLRGRFPGFRMPDDHMAVFERRAGYLLVERCVAAHLEQATRLGAELRTGDAVREWQAAGDQVVVTTDQETFTARRLIIAGGAWAPQLLSGFGLHLEVRRKPQFWFATGSDRYRSDAGCPAYMFETPRGIFYGFPQIDELGVKVAEHTGGRTVDDPLTVDRQLDPADEEQLEWFVSQHLPEVTRRCTRHSVCMYTMSQDENFVLDLHPRHPQVVFAAGLSGHGFKFTCVLGEALADLALRGQTGLPVSFLGLAGR